MNVLFLTLSKINRLSERGIYRDFLRQLSYHGHSVTVVNPIEKRENCQTQFKIEGKTTILSVKVGNITKCRNLIEKGISTIFLQSHYIAAIKKYCSDTKYDLVLYVTPPITFSKVVKYIKKRDNASSYLMLKDIFPQNALDINLLPSWGPWKILVWWFKHQEKPLYKLSDYIGCMSPKNVSYLLEHNPEIPADRVEVCPNSIEPLLKFVNSNDKKRKSKPLTFLYGGNLGKPQGIPFLIDCLKDNINKTDRKFIVCGTGTETHLLQSFLDAYNPRNVEFISGLPVDEYEKMVLECDVGMIFLDHRFTIPNFPSRILSYMEKSIPILACTDPNTDMGEIIVKGKMGWWCESNDVQAFTALVDSICSMSEKKLKEIGVNAREYLDNNYTVQHTYDIVMKHFVEDIDHVQE